MAHSKSRKVFFIAACFLIMSDKTLADASQIGPINVQNMQLNCNLNYTGNYTLTDNISGPYSTSIRAWETNYTQTANSEIRCPNGYILVGLIDWLHSDSGGGHVMSDIRGYCQQLTVSCSWQ